VTVQKQVIHRLD